MTSPDVTALNAAFDQMDTATTACATAQTAIAARIQALLDQIAGAATPADTAALVARATAEVAKLQPIADALTAMGSDTAAPVPVAVPAPEPPPAPAG